MRSLVSRLTRRRRYNPRRDGSQQPISYRPPHPAWPPPSDPWLPAAETIIIPRVPQQYRPEVNR